MTPAYARIPREAKATPKSVSTFADMPDAAASRYDRERNEMDEKMTEFRRLVDIDAGAQLDALPKSQLRDLQRALGYVGYALGTVDGSIGPKTRNPWAEFVADSEQGDPKTLTAGAIDALKQRISAMSAALDVSLANKEQVKAAVAAV